MKIELLLNPPQDAKGKGGKSSTKKGKASESSSANSTSTPSKSTQTPQKLAKDAPVFRKGNPKGKVLFPPYEAGDDENLAQEHRRFRMFPMGQIAEFCNHIPYSSDKKTFLTKTGRDAFEVFQYTFRIPENLDRKEYTVMWDYNIGLVRITPFFKSCNYSKTTPARMLNLNSGLRDITHSITGGALAAQGYWMPYEAAKAVASTFCYAIRYALTPVFGPEFPSSCIPPSDRRYGCFKIDPSIIRGCIAETQSWLRRNDVRMTPKPGHADSQGPSAISSRSSSPQTITVDSQSSKSVAHEYIDSFPVSPISDFSPFSRLRTIKSKSSNLAPLESTATDAESGYGTETDENEDRGLDSPDISPKSIPATIVRLTPNSRMRLSALPPTAKIPSWTSINDPSKAFRSTKTLSPKEDAALGLQLLASPPPKASNHGYRHDPSTGKAIGLGLVIPRSAPRESVASIGSSLKRSAKRLHEHIDGLIVNDGGITSEPRSCSESSLVEDEKGPTLEVQAAYTLLQLGLADEDKHMSKSTKRAKRARRASK